ncbi:hypothetical protein LMG28690_03603 [Paraburkholderia caffeinilytica]|nr:hypothetical protein LMG28690_03603 [Paraburkholderia caffeinilytica]
MRSRFASGACASNPTQVEAIGLGEVFTACTFHPLIKTLRQGAQKSARTVRHPNGNMLEKCQNALAYFHHMSDVKWHRYGVANGARLSQQDDGSNEGRQMCATSMQNFGAHVNEEVSWTAHGRGALERCPAIETRRQIILTRIHLALQRGGSTTEHQNLYGRRSTLSGLPSASTPRRRFLPATTRCSP